MRLASVPEALATMTDAPVSATEAVVGTPPEQLQELLARAGALGVEVVSVTPIRRTLEALLLDEVEQARPVDAAKLGVLA